MSPFHGTVDYLIEVWRDGRVVMIPAVEIVPGAFIELEAGDLAPTDARLLEASSLKSVEAELTGESETVSERAVTLDQDDAPLGNRRNMVFVNYRQINQATCWSVTSTAASV